MRFSGPAATPLHSIRGFLVDLDGVVYRGSEVVPGAPEFFHFLQERQIPRLMITNNSTRTPAQFAERLRGMGVPIQAEEVLTSAEAAAGYLAEQLPAGARVLVIGEEGLIHAVASRGFVVSSRDNADCVVVGLDRAFDYGKLKAAMRAIMNGAAFVGTNPDTSLPTEEGPLPGAGALQAAISTASSRAPLIIGKPEPTMLQVGARRLGLRPEQVAVIGDRLDTDVVGGRRAGMTTVLVLTGIAQRADLGLFSVQPDYIVEDLFDLARRLNNGMPFSPTHSPENV
ncbi:MAG: HAD family hydrolase [Chloroflexi bacterium]|nr:HAD family hydrolase [Chloroflexota bacterium]